MTLEESIACSNCGQVMAEVFINDDGNRVLNVPKSLKLIADKERNVAKAVCPTCGFENQTELDFWRRF